MFVSKNMCLFACWWGKCWSSLFAFLSTLTPAVKVTPNFTHFEVLTDANGAFQLYTSSTHHRKPVTPYPQTSPTHPLEPTHVCMNYTLKGSFPSVLGVSLRNCCGRPPGSLCRGSLPHRCQPGGRAGRSCFRVLVFTCHFVKRT